MSFLNLKVDIFISLYVEETMPVQLYVEIFNFHLPPGHLTINIHRKEI